MNESWYRYVQADAPVSQGDIILECPVVVWESEGIDYADAGGLEGAVAGFRADVVVMTQACDLEQKKVRRVVLCPHQSLDDYEKDWEAERIRQNQNPTSRAWKRHCQAIKEGVNWNLSMLNRGKANTLSISHRIVDFHEIYTLPRNFLEHLLRERRAPRLRLRPPYREHLSQAFARFFMRVGLPVDVSEAW